MRRLVPALRQVGAWRGFISDHQDGRDATMVHTTTTHPGATSDSHFIWDHGRCTAPLPPGPHLTACSGPSDPRWIRATWVAHGHAGPWMNLDGTDGIDRKKH